jgi:hypothetical protein
MIMFNRDDRSKSMYAHEGLTTYLSTKPIKLERLSHDEYLTLSPALRATYNRARMRHMATGMVLTTPQLLRAKKQVAKYKAQNFGDNSGNRGLIVSGDPTTGKTTMMKELMRWCFDEYEDEDPGFVSRGTVPVVYTEVPTGSTGKALMVTFAYFFGLTIAQRDTMQSILHRVISAMTAAGTQLVIIDELHNLNAKNLGNGETIQILKELQNRVPATFVYAGLNLDDGDLFAGTIGQQISSRFSELKLSRYNRSNADDVAAWKVIVDRFERKLPLAHQEKGDLVKLSSYLHDRTNGSIGSLKDLLTGSAFDAINGPSGQPEAITREILDDQLIDKTSEDNRKVTSNRKTKGARKS